MDVTELKRPPKEDNEKKKNKGAKDAELNRSHKEGKEKKKNKGTKDVMKNIESGANGEDSTGDAIDNVGRKRKKSERNNKDDPSVVAELNRPHKGGKEKKKNKGTEGVVKNIEAGAYGEDSTGDVIDNIGRKTKKRERNNKDDPSDVGIAEDAMSERKNNQDGDMEKGTNNGEDVGINGANCEVYAAETVERKKKRKSKKEGSKEINGNEEEVKNSEAKLDYLANDLVSKTAVDNENNRKKMFGIFSEGRDDDSDMVGRKKKNKKHSNESDKSYNGHDSLVHSDELQSNKAESLEREKEKSIKHDRKGKRKSAKLVENGSGEREDSEVSVNQKRKKIKLADNVPDDIRDNEVTPVIKGKNIAENDSYDSVPNKSNKKVRFSGNVEVFTLPNDLNAEEGNDDGDSLVRGKRFTSEEDELVKEAVRNYILRHDLGEEGLDMVLNSSKHSKLRGCWKEIGSAIPYRPYNAVYYRAQVLFRRSESRKWTEEEYNEVLKYQEMHGNQWKPLADELGKHRWHVKDTWRRLKLANLKKGNWSQEEYQALFDLVNVDLQLKVSEEKKSKHGMLRDNICWTSISDKLSTRNHVNCCIKWYNQLTSPMVAQGLWADVDDYRLLGELYSLDATCIEDVDWDHILDNRPGDICRKRWNQMATHLGRHGNKSFADQVEVLAQRYCPHLLEARETWDSKPRVP